MKMKNLIIIGLLAGLSATALTWAALPGKKTAQYEPRQAKISAEAGYKGAVEWTHARRANQVTGAVDLKDMKKHKLRFQMYERKKPA